MEKAEIPKKAIYRLSIYQRCLSKLHENGKEMISSSALAGVAGVKPAQLRKDLTYFGQFGKRGLGYSVVKLRDAICEVLGREQLQPVVMVGAGNLGVALLRYRGFEKEGFKVVAAFDAVPELVVSLGISVPVYGQEEVTRFVRENGVRLAILCVPGGVAQEAARELVDAGVQGILNFSPTLLQVPDAVTVNNVDLALELENLSYFVSHAEE